MSSQQHQCTEGSNNSNSNNIYTMPTVRHVRGFWHIGPVGY